jgi:hypothetical protein
MNQKLFPMLGISALVLLQSLEMNAVGTNAVTMDMAAARYAWVKDGFAFTPAVQNAVLADVQARARRELEAEGKALPQDFLAWVDSDPVLKTTVYGARRDAAGILLMLRSLELDLGRDAMRKNYTQLALAMAVVAAREGHATDISERGPLVLQIPGDPRRPVDTKETGRALDLNDHIINFLNDHTLEEDVVIGQKEEAPELRYDDKGVAIPMPKKGKPKMSPITEKRTRSLYAADVIASEAWQEKFNAYLKEKGQTSRVECGERIIHWKSSEMVRGEMNKKIGEAFKLFRAAYEAKGLLPAARDPLATPAERCAYLIRNNEHVFPADAQEQRKWPRFPLNAPWPVLTMLVDYSQPLREREERWVAFRDKGETRTYGEYIGGVAQQFDMQSARRIKPHPFTYGTIQMMLKDGGVCGTMANIGVRTYNVLGIPASTAGQPGHCALVTFGFDPKTGTYACRGGQYATAGDAGTGVHASWLFGDVDARKPMVYHQSIAWAVNHGLQGYLDSTVAHTFFKQLPEEDRREHGARLLATASAMNPFNFLLVDDAMERNGTAEELVAFWKHLQLPLAAGKPGCPTNGLYHDTIRAKLFARLATLPVPTGQIRAEHILAFMKEESCENQVALVSYRLATAGLPALLSETEAAFSNHVASVRTDESCAARADELAAVAGKIAGKKERAAWAVARWQELQGRELYLGRRNKITADKSLAVLGKLAGKKSRPEAEQQHSLLDQLAARFQESLTAPRTAQSCRTQAAQISDVAGQLKDKAVKHAWLAGLAKAIEGKETYVPADVEKNPKSRRDPCADTLAKLLNTEAKSD